MRQKNAYVTLEETSEGVYLNYYPEIENGESITIEGINSYLHNVHVECKDKVQLVKLLSTKQPGRILLCTEEISSSDEYIIVRVNHESYEAKVTFYPPTSSGKRLDADAIKATLKKYDVKAGVQEQLIEELLQSPVYFTEIILAKGKAVVQGKNGRIEYHFDAKKIPRPKLLEDGSVDYKDLDLINHVAAGQVVATLIPEVQGVSGFFLNGKVVLPGKVKRPTFKYGKNIRISEDGLQLIADISGHVSIVNEKVTVSNTLEVKQHVDSSTGDIHYEGDVLVNGNVLSGHSIRATGKVVVKGVVEDASIYAEGPIVINGGIQGRLKGHVQSKSNVVSKFIENATVVAGGSIQADTIRFSNVYAVDEIVVTGKKGFVIGGQVRSSHSIHAKLIGSAMETKTRLEIVANLQKIEELKRLEQELQEISQEKIKLEKILKFFLEKHTKGIALTKEQIDTIKKIKVTMTEMAANTHHKMICINEISEELETLDQGRILVDQCIHPGTKLVINRAEMMIHKDTYQCEFVKEGADIKMMQR